MRFPNIFQSTPPVKAATLAANGLLRTHGFQSTPPVKAATQALERFAAEGKISIHAAREGGDPFDHVCVSASIYFNPRRP